jgi:uncharacterized protein YkwD
MLAEEWRTPTQDGAQAMLGPMDRQHARPTRQDIAFRRWRVNVGLVAVVIACVFGSDMMPAQAVGPDTYAAELGKLVNDYRKQHALAPLTADPRLEMLANAHSADMAGAHRMSHDGFQARMQKTGYKLCVENVGWNYPGARQQFEGWKNSPGHDKNLRDAGVTRMGIGRATGYVTFIACG